jgi:hypothetical protein
MSGAEKISMKKYDKKNFGVVTKREAKTAMTSLLWNKLNEEEENTQENRQQGRQQASVTTLCRKPIRQNPKTKNYVCEERANKSTQSTILRTDNN